MIFSGKGNKRLQKFLLSGVAALSLLTINTVAFAEPDVVYVLQLGSFETRQQAEQKWQELKNKNPDALGKLSLHVSEISMTGDDKTTYRTQAGPVETRAKASEICGKLFAQGSECYVVETAMFAQEHLPENAPASTVTEMNPAEPERVASVYTPPAQAAAAPGDQMVAGRGQQFLDASSQPQEQKSVASVAPPATYVPAAAPQQPASSTDEDESPAAARNSGSFLFGHAPRHYSGNVQTAAAERPASEPTPTPVSGKHGFFNWFGSSSPTTAPVTMAPVTPVAVAPVTEPEGNVNVAEAIRVPLTRDNTSSLPPVVAVAPAATQQINMPAPDSNGIFWAQVSYFQDEANAHNFYEAFRNAYPDISDGIRMRITRPYAYANTRGRVTLRMGTFALASDIRAICAMASQQHLNCVSVKDASPVGAGATYQSRNTDSTLPKAFSSVTAAPAVSSGHFLDAPQPVENVAYWVQFGSFDSYEDASDKWKHIQKSNKKMLSKLRPSITEPEMSSSSRKLFRLRAGPFKNRGVADSLCDKLSSHGESCIVLGENPLFN